MINRKLSKEEVDAVISALRDNAAPLPIVIEFSRDNYDLLFSNGKETPVGHVKMGDGQFDKFSDKHRKHQLSMADSTLAFPEIIIEKPSQAKFGQITERPSSYIFVKTFLSTNNKDGVLFYNSITVKKTGLKS